MKLNDLDPRDQVEIIADRKAGAALMREQAFRTGDPICLMACELDAQARLLGLDPTYDETVDQSEL